MRKLGLATVLALVVGTLPATALQWYQHYERGLELASQGEWEQALEDLQAAAELEGRPRAQVRTYGSRFIFAYDPAYHQARCYIELGRWREAEEQLASAMAAGVTPASDLAALRDRLEMLRAASAPPPPVPPPALLVVESSPPGATVLLDGVRLGATPTGQIPVASGGHELRLQSSGFEDWHQRVEPVSGEVLHVDVALRPRPATATPSDAPERTREEGIAAVPEPAARRGPSPAVQDPEPRQVAAPARGETSPVVAVPGAGSPSAPDQVEPGPVAAVEPRAEVAGSVGAAPAAEPADPGAPAEPAADDGAEGSRLLWGGTLGALLLAGGGVGFGLLWRRRGGPRRDPNGMPRLPSRRIGHYRVLEELGRGGMATTYRGRRLADGKVVALKIPHPTGDPAYLTRFVREGKLGETLHHPGIVRIFEAAQDRNVAFLAMELIPGRSLKEEIEAVPEGLPLANALEIVQSVAEALDYAHSKGVIHRDLKPENIMLLPDGSLKVMDFGVARIDGQPGLTTSRFFFGSPLYAAPELVEQPRSVDRRADLYSLGILLFELLEGRPPFIHESVFKVLEMHQRQPLPDPASLPRPLPPELWAVIRRLCEKEPERRYGTAQELLVDLKRLLYAPHGEVSRMAAGQGASPG